MRRYGHADQNQRDITQALRGLGYGVVNLTLLGGGVPDLLACSPDGKRLFLLEVKNPQGRDRVEESQKSWAVRWPGSVHVVRSVDEALAAVGLEVAQ